MKTGEFHRKSECSVDLLLLLGTVAILALSTPHGLAQSTAFTYQGRLNDNGLPAMGIYDLRFTIWPAPGTRSVVNSPIQASPVTNGLFTVTLDFGAGIFTGPARWLEIGGRPAGSGNFTTLMAVAFERFLFATKLRSQHLELEHATREHHRQRHEQIYHRESADRQPLLSPFRP